MKRIGHIVRSITAGAIVALVAWIVVQSSNQARAADAGGAAGASVTLAGARHTYQMAMSKLVTVRQAAMKVATNDPEYRAAVQLADKTHAAYQASQKNNSDAALSNPKYQALLKKKQSLEAELAKLQGSSSTSIEARAELAQKKLELKEQMKAIEEQITSASGSPDLKKQWQDACKAVEVLEVKLIAKCEQTPVVIDARKQAEAADQALKQAMAENASAQASYREELRQEIKSDYDQRRQEVMNWASTRYYNGGHYYGW